MDTGDGRPIGRTQLYLFYGGMACFVVALVLAAFAVVTGVSGKDTDTVTNAPVTTDATQDEADVTAPENATSTTEGRTTGEGEGESGEETGAGSETHTTGNAGTTSPPSDGKAQSSTADEDVFTDGNDSPPPTGENGPIDVPADGSPAERAAAVAQQVPFDILYLQREGWQLSSLEAARDSDGNAVVVLVYERGDDFMNINLRQAGASQRLGQEGREIQARGTTIQVQDMVGLHLALWEEGGASVLISTTVGGDNLLRLLEALETAS